MRLSVIVPAFNEATRLPATLEAACAWLDTHVAGDYELLVVDDGSTDATADVVRAWTEKKPHIRLIEQPQNRGKGAAVRRGMLEAVGDVRLFMDADHSTHVGEVEKVFAALQDDADVVIASRRHPESDIEVHQSWLREHMGQGFNLIMRSIVGSIPSGCSVARPIWRAAKEASQRISAEGAGSGQS